MTKEIQTIVPQWNSKLAVEDHAFKPQKSSLWVLSRPLRWNKDWNRFEGKAQAAAAAASAVDFTPNFHQSEVKIAKFSL